MSNFKKENVENQILTARVGKNNATMKQKKVN